MAKPTLVHMPLVLTAYKPCGRPYFARRYIEKTMMIQILDSSSMFAKIKVNRNLAIFLTQASMVKTTITKTAHVQRLHKFPNGAFSHLAMALAPLKYMQVRSRILLAWNTILEIVNVYCVENIMKSSATRPF